MQILQKGEGEVIVVDVRPGALFRLFGLDGGRYGGQIIEADPHSFPQFDYISAAFDTAPKTLEDRVAVLDGALLSLAEIARPYGIGEKFQFVADLTKGTIRVDDAAERLGVSARTLERDCRLRFGRTPKRILRGWRLAHAMSTAHSDEGPVRWKATNPEANYSDQAHFLRDHREMGGMNPTEMYESFRALDPKVILHPRGDPSASRHYDDLGAANEHDDNFRFRAFGSEVAEELGLVDWKLTGSTG